MNDNNNDRAENGGDDNEDDDITFLGFHNGTRENATDEERLVRNFNRQQRRAWQLFLARREWRAVDSQASNLRDQILRLRGIDYGRLVGVVGAGQEQGQAGIGGQQQQSANHPPPVPTSNGGCDPVPSSSECGQEPTRNAGTSNSIQSPAARLSREEMVLPSDPVNAIENITAGRSATVTDEIYSALASISGFPLDILPPRNDHSNEHHIGAGMPHPREREGENNFAERYQSNRNCQPEPTTKQHLEEHGNPQPEEGAENEEMQQQDVEMEEEKRKEEEVENEKEEEEEEEGEKMDEEEEERDEEEEERDGEGTDEQEIRMDVEIGILHTAPDEGRESEGEHAESVDDRIPVPAATNNHLSTETQWTGLHPLLNNSHHQMEEVDLRPAGGGPIRSIQTARTSNTAATRRAHPYAQTAGANTPATSQSIIAQLLRALQLPLEVQTEKIISIIRPIVDTEKRRQRAVALAAAQGKDPGERKKGRYFGESWDKTRLFARLLEHDSEGCAAPENLSLGCQCPVHLYERHITIREAFRLVLKEEQRMAQVTSGNQQGGGVRGRPRAAEGRGGSGAQRVQQAATAPGGQSTQLRTGNNTTMGNGSAGRNGNSNGRNGNERNGNGNGRNGNERNGNGNQQSNLQNRDRPRPSDPRRPPQHHEPMEMVNNDQATSTSRLLPRPSPVSAAATTIISPPSNRRPLPAVNTSASSTNQIGPAPAGNVPNGGTQPGGHTATPNARPPASRTFGTTNPRPAASFPRSVTAQPHLRQTAPTNNSAPTSHIHLAPAEQRSGGSRPVSAPQPHAQQQHQRRQLPAASQRSPFTTIMNLMGPLPPNNHQGGERGLGNGQSGRNGENANLRQEIGNGNPVEERKKTAEGERGKGRKEAGREMNSNCNGTRNGSDERNQESSSQNGGGCIRCGNGRTESSGKSIGNSNGTSQQSRTITPSTHHELTPSNIQRRHHDSAHSIPAQIASSSRQIQLDLVGPTSVSAHARLGNDRMISSGGRQEQPNRQNVARPGGQQRPNGTTAQVEFLIPKARFSDRTRPMAPIRRHSGSNDE